ncbi:hypothetical protein JAAARDRAFT_532145 [Jaapia argillacea MUCL 33604]|uniref:Uncharacterized protein n=1 Tax=Jaapia argillacea MUCL 33604 TaxID=933084 RepID=A0A067P980_9AGAM|nr:hypothetical protein JAAARDRAFT_532145 [Jaapia argillacea MUCL 33604]
MTTPDPYGFRQSCGSWTDTQLMTDTFSNLGNTTFTFRCCGGLGCKDQTGPVFQSCSDVTYSAGNFPYPTFCIGGLNQQHACAATNCQKIDWSGATSPGCAQSIVDFMNVQPPGAADACCDSTGCIPGNDYACTSSRSLQMCVSDGYSVECIDPRANTICSGNFTNPVAINGGSSTAPPAAAQTTTSSSSSGGGGGGGLSASDKATIAGSILGGVASIVAIVTGIRKCSK